MGQFFVKVFADAEQQLPSRIKISRMIENREIFPTQNISGSYMHVPAKDIREC